VQKSKKIVADDVLEAFAFDVAPVDGNLLALPPDLGSARRLEKRLIGVAVHVDPVSDQGELPAVLFRHRPEECIDVIKEANGGNAHLIAEQEGCRLDLRFRAPQSQLR